MSAQAPAGVRRRWLLGGLLGSATVISALTVASRVAGFGRTVVFSHEVGAACVGNAYTTANLLPNVLYEVAAGGALAAAVVPVLAGPLSRQSRDGPEPDELDEVARIASGLLTWAVLVLGPLSLLLALMAGPLAAVVLPQPQALCPGQRELAANMIVIFAPQVLCYGVGAVLAGVLQAQHRFTWPAVAPLLSSLVVVVGYLGYAATAGTGEVPGLPAAALAWLAGGTTLGVVVMTLPLALPIVRPRGGRPPVRLRPTLRLPDAVAGRAAALAAAGIAGLLAQQAFVVATVLLANARGRTDTLTLFQYVQTVSLLPYAVLAVPLATATFPRLAERASRGDGPGFAELAATSTRAVLTLGAAGAALVAGTAPAVAGFFQALDRFPPAGMDGALTAIAPGLVGLALIAHLGRALYALERGRVAATAIAAGWLSAAALAWVAVLAGAGAARTVVALAAASSVGTVLAGAGLVAAVRRARGGVAVHGVRRTALVAVTCAVLAALVGRVVALAVLAAAGPGLLAGVGAGVAAGVTVIVVMALGIRVGDPGALSALRRHPAEPGVAAEGRPLSVLFVLGTSQGGVGRHVAAVARGLRARGCRVGVAGPATTLTGFDYAQPGVRTHPMPIADRARPAADLRTAVRLGGFSRAYDVVHAHGLRAGALAVLGVRSRLTTGPRTPVLVTLHNALVGSGQTAVVHRVLERVVARGADEVLVVSADLELRMRALGATRVARALVPAPVTVSEQGGGGPQGQRGQLRAEVRAELGVPDQAALLVTVARLAPQKGLELLLDAVSGWAGRAVVMIAGEGPLRAVLEQSVDAGALPVRLLGRRDDVPRLLAAADLVLVPSRWEGQPLIVQEALRAGAAVLATDVGGTRELAGDAVRLVPWGDPAALRHAVLDLLDHPGALAELRRRALVRAAGLPTDTDAVDQLLGVYTRLAGAAERLPSRPADDVR